MATKNKQTRIQQNSNNETGISLCIPFVFKTVSKEKIFAVIRSMKVGHIERIDIVNVSGRQNKAFIHFAKGKWRGGFMLLYLLVSSCVFLYRVKIGCPNDDSLCLSSLPRLKKCWPR